MEGCLAWSFTWFWVYVFLHDINFAIEFMIIKFARNVKVGVTASIAEDWIRIWSSFDKCDTWNRNNKWNSKGDKGQVLHLCRNNPLKYRIENHWLGNTSSEKCLRLQQMTAGHESTVPPLWKKQYPPQDMQKGQQSKWCEAILFMLRQLQCWDPFWANHFKLRKSKGKWQEWWEDRKTVRNQKD